MKHPVPETHLKYIGDITVSFALLESQIQDLIGSLINEHQRIGQIITAQLSFKNLRALVISLYIERHGKDGDYDKLRLLINNAVKIEENRNNIIHSIWAAGKDKDHITRVKRTAHEGSGLKFQFEDFSVDKLLQFTDEIKELVSKVQDFYFEMLKEGKIINNPIKKMW